MAEAFICDAVRSPRGRGRRGSLYHVKPLSPVTDLFKELRRRPDRRTRWPVCSPTGFCACPHGFVVRAGEPAGRYGERFEPPASLVTTAEKGERYG